MHQSPIKMNSVPKQTDITISPFASFTLEMSFRDRSYQFQWPQKQSIYTQTTDKSGETPAKFELDILWISMGNRKGPRVSYRNTLSQNPPSPVFAMRWASVAWLWCCPLIWSFLFLMNDNGNHPDDQNVIFEFNFIIVIENYSTIYTTNDWWECVSVLMDLVLSFSRSWVNFEVSVERWVEWLIKFKLFKCIKYQKRRFWVLHRFFCTTV